MSYISADDVRRAGGFPADLISDTLIEGSLEVIEPLVERLMNTRFTVVNEFENHNGTRDNYFFVLKTPLLRVNSLYVGGVEIDLEDIKISRESGKISTNVETYNMTTGNFIDTINVNYDYGYLIRSDDVFKTQADLTAGSSVKIYLDGTTGLAVDDWVEVKGRNGYVDFAQITDVDTDVDGDYIIVDKLSYNHYSSSNVIKFILPSFIKRFIELEAVIYLSLNAIGSTYIFNASYSLGDLQVTKGVPYTHWRESLEKAIKERDMLRHAIKPRFKIL